MDKTWSGGGDTDSQVVNIGRHVSAWCWTSQSKGFKEKKRKERKEKAKLKLREELSWEYRRVGIKKQNKHAQWDRDRQSQRGRLQERERKRGRAANLMNHMDMVLLSINSIYLFIFCQENENLIDWLILFYICLCLKVRKTIYKYI